MQSNFFVLHSYLSTESAEKCVPEMAQCKCKVFVEEVS